MPDTEPAKATPPAAERPTAAMLLYPGFTHLDLTGPHACLAGAFDVHLVAATPEPVVSDQGLAIVPTHTLQTCPDKVDLVFVPGGMGTADVLTDRPVIDFVRDRGRRARYVTAVCSGSLVLGAAGLLNATLGMILAGFDGQLTEHDTVPSGLRIDAENTVISWAERGVGSSVVRLPPTVHSPGDYGFVSALIGIARATGLSGYLGEGANRWPSAHTHDVGRLYRLALESAPAGARLNAVAEQGITVRRIAETIGRRLGLPVAPIAAEDAAKHFGHRAVFVGLDNPTSSEITREMLGWKPTRSGLIAELEQDRDLV